MFFYYVKSPKGGATPVKSLHHPKDKITKEFVDPIVGSVHKLPDVLAKATLDELCEVYPLKSET